MKNYWTIVHGHGIFEYTFLLEEHQYNVNTIILILNLVVNSGKKYEVYNILSAFDKTDLSSIYLKKGINSILEYEKKRFSNKEKLINGDFFVGTTPIVYEDVYLEDYTEGELLFQSHCKLAYYDKNGNIEIKNIFNVSEFYSLLNPYRIHLYHENEGTSAPLELELTVLENKTLQLRISSGLGIWLPYLRADFDTQEQSLKDFPLNEKGYIDNRELYLLNTPRLIGFIKEIRTFFIKNKGKEISNYGRLERMPELPWY